MIEFKAECGHTVRAKDEDAGGVVRCSYCGRNAAVPLARGDDLDFLLTEIDRTAKPAGKGRRPRASLRRLMSPRTSATFDPFSLIFRMCYLALLLCIVIWVGRKYVVPMFQEGGWIAEWSNPTSAVPTLPPRDRPVRPTRSGREPVGEKHGLIGGMDQGLYVLSTPPGATFFLVEKSKAPMHGRISDVPGSIRGRANGEPLRVSDGTYVVEVVLPWNDPSINNPDLPHYEEYIAFRRALERASAEERIRLLESYFVPDEASPVFVDQTEEQIYLVRQYRDVVVRNGRAKAVRALFLPRIATGGSDRFSIAQLVLHYVPKKRAYTFNERNVRVELDYYRVPDADQLFIVDALERIGIVPYRTPDGDTRLFKIGVYDGVFATQVVRAAGE